jgi:hypothetical protein
VKKLAFVVVSGSRWKRLAIVIILSSGLAVGIGFPARSEGTSTPVIPATGNSDVTPTGADNGGLTFDGVLGTINDSLDTVDGFLDSGGELVDGWLGEAGGFLSGLLGDTGGQIEGFFRDVAKVINLIDRVANGVGKIEGFWKDFYRSVLGGVGEGKECVTTSPVSVNTSSDSPIGFTGIDYDPSTWCFGILNSTGGSGSGDGLTIGDGEPNVTVVDAPSSPAEIFIGEPNVEIDGGASRPKSVPEMMALVARGTAMGIPDPIELRQVANEVDIQSSDLFETIPPVRTYHALDSVENTVVRLIGVQPVSKAGQKQIADTVGAIQQTLVRSAQLAASAQGKNITQDVMKDTASIVATQSTILGSIASDSATNRLQTGATNLALSTISRQLSEQQKYERARIGVLAGQLLIEGFSSDLNVR